MSLSKPVGKNVHGQNPNDVKTVQGALASCKCKRYKPLYQGRIDGKCGPKTVAAIEKFQAENNIRVTGKVETYGTTISRLKQKAPSMRMSSGTRQTTKATPNSACIGLDPNKVMKTNNALADTIIRSWPLPKKEAEELAKVVLRVGQELVIPLAPFGRQPVNIDTQGAFSVKFDIPSWGYNNDIPTRNKMVAAVCDMISKSPAWQKGDSISLRFRSATVYAFFREAKEPSDNYLKSIGINKSQLCCPVLLKIAGAGEYLLTNGEK